MKQGSNRPSLPPSNKAATPPNVVYARNPPDMRQEDLHTETLPTSYLYSKINIGTEAAQFFSQTLLGANLDLRLRNEFTKGFEALLSASPGDIGAVADAQTACRAVILTYDMFAASISEGQSCKSQITMHAKMDEDEADQGE